MNENVDLNFFMDLKIERITKEVFKVDNHQFDNFNDAEKHILSLKKELLEKLNNKSSTDIINLFLTQNNLLNSILYKESFFRVKKGNDKFLLRTNQSFFNEIIDIASLFLNFKETLNINISIVDFLFYCLKDEVKSNFLPDITNKINKLKLSEDKIYELLSRNNKLSLEEFYNLFAINIFSSMLFVFTTEFEENPYIFKATELSKDNYNFNSFVK